MVPRRARQAEGILGLALEHGVDGHASGAAGIVGRLERLPADKRVAGAQPAGARLDVPPHPHQIVARVAGENLIVGRRPWLVGLQGRKVVALLQRPQHGVITLRPFGPVSPGHVAPAHLVGHQRGRQAGRRRLQIDLDPLDQRSACGLAQQRGCSHAESNRSQELPPRCGCFDRADGGKWAVHRRISEGLRRKRGQSASLRIALSLSSPIHTLPY